MASVLCLSVPGGVDAEPRSEMSSNTSQRNGVSEQVVVASSSSSTTTASARNNTELPSVERVRSRSVGDELTLRPPQPPPITPQRRNRRGRAARASVSSIALTDPAALDGPEVPPEVLPDILHAHLPPPYCSLPLPVTTPTSAVMSPAEQCASSQLPSVCVPPPPRNTALPGGCFTENYSLIGFARRRRSVYGGGRSVCSDGRQKSCCGGGGGACCGFLLLSQTVSVRWFIVIIAFVGLSCAVVGTVLGTLRSAGRQNLTVALLMISVGIVLVTVSAVAWRLTAGETSSCCNMLGLGGSARLDFDLEQGVTRLPTSDVGTVLTSSGRRLAQRVVPGYGRPHHPYAAMVYPEFQFRPPPPSYHASMQAYRLGLLLDQHSSNQHRAPTGSSTCNTAAALTLSPPPAYRAHGTLRSTFQRQLTLSALSERSQPPSYHSRQSSAVNGDASAPSRTPRQTLVYESPLDGNDESLAPVSVVGVDGLRDNIASRCSPAEIVSVVTSVGEYSEDTFGAIKSLRRKRRSKQAPPRSHSPRDREPDVDVKESQSIVTTPSPSLLLSVVPCVSADSPAPLRGDGEAGEGSSCLVSVVHTEPDPCEDTLVLSVDAANSSPNTAPTASQVQILAHL